MFFFTTGELIESTDSDTNQKEENYIKDHF